MGNIIENKKLIAKFMGGEDDSKYVGGRQAINFPKQKYGRDGEMFAYADLKYDTDWNWIMSVVEKIDTLSESNKGVLHWSRNNWTIFDILIVGGKIEAVYNAVVEFIKWYNLQIK